MTLHASPLILHIVLSQPKPNMSSDRGQYLGGDSFCQILLSPDRGTLVFRFRSSVVRVYLSASNSRRPQTH